MAPVSSAAATPLFSLVSAVHGVEDFLPEFLASIDAQTLDHRSFELVAVVDGSEDRSQELLEEWGRTTDVPLTVVWQHNQGQGAARNRGLELARGTWVGFPDPDDVLSPDYLEQVAAGVADHPEAAVVACRLVMRRDVLGTTTDDHPLDHRFDPGPHGGTTLRDLTEEPGAFFVSVPCGFYLRERVERDGLRFDVRLRPNFEDGHFGARYLLGLDRPRVLFVRGARYEYRKRADGSSTQQTSVAHPGRWTTVFGLGYLDLLRRARRQGEVPAWLSQLVMYELGWLLRPWVRALTETDPGLVAVQADFHTVMAEIAPLVDTTLPTAWHPRFTQVWRDVVRHGWSEEPWHGDVVRVVRHDADQGLVCLAYHSAHGPRAERYVLGGAEVGASSSTTKPFRVMGRAVLVERFVWVPLGAGGLRVELDGRPVPFGLPGGPQETLRPEDVPAASRVARRSPLPAGDPRRRTRRWADVAPVRRRFADAWVLMDRVHDADDNAQRLFEHLREHRRDVNAWFVVERGTAAWDRLRGRHGRRVVAYGSRRWRLLLLNATHLLSSHADPGVMRPSSLVGPDEAAPWRFTFLQHGVIKDDLSTWLNPKPIDLFVVSTPDERDSVLGGDTNYVFTSREVVLTGLPRFDRLLRLGEEVPDQDRDLVLVCPTWRSWLTAPMGGDSQRREVLEEFGTSQFRARWAELLVSDALRLVAERHGVRVAFLPHPNLQAAMADLQVPTHVEVVRHDDTDVQGLLARTRVMLTDYSSMAFNAAYLDRPTVYYQFDADRVLGGEHVGTRGYFGYETHGFGPVVADLVGAVAGLEELLADGAGDGEVFARRRREAFPQRDGRCCERVVAAVEGSTRAVGPTTTADPDAHHERG